MKTNKTKIFLALFIVLSVLMSMATLTVYASDERTVVEEHYFTDKGTDTGTNGTPFFTMGESSSYSKASEKGEVTYNGTAITNCLKMNSKGTVSFTTDVAGTLKLVFNENAIGKEFLINDTVYVVGSDTTCTVELASGSYTVKRQSAEIYLYYISFTYTTTDAPVHTCVFKDVEGGTILEPTCTTAGSKTQACECGETQVVEIPATGHTPTNFATTAPTADAAGATTAVCSVCEVAINYGATQVMTPGTYVLDASALEGINQGDYKDGEVKVINDVFAVHLSGKYKTESNKKEFSDGYTSSHRMNHGGATARDDESGAIRNAIEITTTGKTTIKIHWVCGETGRQVGLYTLEKDGESYTFDYLCNTEEASTKNGLYVSTLEVSAGTYYIGAVVPEGIKDGGNYHYRIEVTVEEPEHVNSLVVGDTNKIVVSGNTLNDYNLPIEYVPFVATETANYAFVGSNGALAFIFDKNLALISATGVANLEAGEYIVCLGNGVVGEFNVAVTKSAWVNTLVEGTNKIYVDGSINNEYGLPIAWAPFTVTEKANYAFAGNNGALVFIFDASANLISATGSAELEAGEYLICVGGGVVGMFDVTVTKTTDGGSDEQPTETPKAQLGDNTVTIDGTILNVGKTAIAWLEFVVEEAGTYVATSTDLKCYFYSKMDTSDFNACVCGFSGIATLEPGTYYICVGNNGVEGEFTVNVSRSQEEPPHKNSVALGDNHYIVTDKLLDSDDPHEWLTIEITEPGTYVIKGGAPLTIFFFTTPGTLNELSPYGWNVDLSTGYVTEFEVELEEAGTYWMGFRYDAIGDEREFDFNISLKPHEHEFIEGECECGETDPDYKAPSWFDSILDTIKGLFQQLMEYIKNLLASFKKK